MQHRKLVAPGITEFRRTYALGAREAIVPRLSSEKAIDLVAGVVAAEGRTD